MADLSGDFDRKTGCSLELRNKPCYRFGIAQALAAEVVGCKQFLDDWHKMGAIPDPPVCCRVGECSFRPLDVRQQPPPHIRRSTVRTLVDTGQCEEIRIQ